MTDRISLYADRPRRAPAEEFELLQDGQNHDQAGFASDRVVLDVEAIDQATGDFSISGGYSTVDGWLGEVKLGERNFYGTGDTVQTSLSYGQYARGAELSATDPDLFGNHVSGGGQLFYRQTFSSPYQSYGTNSYGMNLSLGTPIAEQTSVLWRIPGVPDEYGLKASAFVDAGSVFGYKGPTTFSGQTAQIANANIVRSSTGVGLTWASPFGALTASYAVPLSKATYPILARSAPARAEGLAGGEARLRSALTGVV